MNRQITIFTREQITSDSISELLVKEFKEKRIICNKKEQIAIGKFPNDFYIDFIKDDFISKTDFDDEIIKAVPIKKARCTDLFYVKPEIAKRVIKVILKVFPDCWIYDEEHEWVGPGKEYLK